MITFINWDSISEVKVGTELHTVGLGDVLVLQTNEDRQLIVGEALEQGSPRCCEADCRHSQTSTPEKWSMHSGAPWVIFTATQDEQDESCFFGDFFLFWNFIFHFELLDQSLKRVWNTASYFPLHFSAQTLAVQLHFKFSQDASGASACISSFCKG